LFLFRHFTRIPFQENKQRFETMRKPTQTSDTMQERLRQFLNFQERFFKEIKFFRLTNFVFVFWFFFLICFINLFIPTLCEKRTLTSWRFERKPTQTFSALRDFFGTSRFFRHFATSFAISEFARTQTLTSDK